MKNPRITVNFNRTNQGATRFFKNLRFFRSFLFLGLGIFGLNFCTDIYRFDQLKKPKEDIALTYILRPSMPGQSVFSFKVELFRFPGSFKEGSQVLYNTFHLDSGEYRILELQPGFYSIRSKDFEKVFYAKEGKVTFLSLQLFSTGAFSLPDLFIKDLNAEEALRILLEGERMYRLEKN